MKTFLQKLVTIVIFVSIYLNTQSLHAQCGAGYTSAQINFDMHYLETSSLPTNPLYFAIGKNSMRFAWSGGSNNVLNDVNGTHTGEALGYGVGNDMQFTVRNGADTLVFEDEVSSVSFSVYDVDRNQVMNVRAYNAAGIALNIGLARVRSGTLTISGNGTTSATATADADSRGTTENYGTANIDISGPVKTIVLTFTRSPIGADPIWISDIDVCNDNSTSGTWANGYQAISTPEIGQPSYILASYGDSIVAVDIVNNSTSLIHEVDNSILIDTLGRPKAINSLAYNPYNQIIYFSDNARAKQNVSVYKYDVKTGVRSTFISDVRDIGIQLFAIGLGSGGCTYYDGALYIGQDMINNAGVSEPVTVYRIEIDPVTGNPSTAVRVWSKVGYNGTTMFYDWADFVINNGVFYNFNSMSTRSTNTGLEHINLNTNTVTNGYSLTSTIVGGSQSGIDYQGNVYHFFNNTLQLYNGASSFGSAVSFTGVTGLSLTDIGEAFKFPYDYGDAPVGYGIAYHLYRTNPNLMIGATVDYEVINSSNSAADADNVKNTGSSNDEDGVTAFPILTATFTSYTVNVRTTNSSGAAATLYGFVDFNRDGDFNDPGERSNAATVPNGATPATPIAVNFVGLTGGSIGSSFIRFRLASNSTEASNRNGYAASGEVEDYPIGISATALPVELVEFKAEAQENNTSLLSWSTASEFNNEYFEVQRKKGNSWNTLGKVEGKGFSNELNNYSFIDETPDNGINYYQLKQVDFDGKTDYSPMVSVTFEKKTETPALEVSLYPNPTTNDIWIKTNIEVNSDNLLDIEVYNIIGERLQTSKMNNNTEKINLSEYQKGIYFIKIGNESYRILKQ